MKRFLLGTLLISISACTAAPTAPTVSQWSLADLGRGPLHATGLATNLTNDHLWLLVPGTGLVEATADGHYVSTIADGASFVDHGFTDVSVLEDGTFALPGSGEGYKYDSVHGVQPYFCLLPGGNFTTMENEAITLDPSSGLIYVAPAYVDQTNKVVSANIAQYSSADGSFVGSVDVLSSGVLAQGLAIDPDHSIWAVQHGALHHFAASGDHLESVALTGVSEAAGLSLVDGTFYVLDGADDAVRIFDRSVLP
jgi:sugar lactone lactonase YvrE